MWIYFGCYTFIDFVNFDLTIKGDYSTEIILYVLVTLDFTYIVSLQNLETFYGYFSIKSKYASKFQSEIRGLQ